MIYRIYKQKPGTLGGFFIHEVIGIIKQNIAERQNEREIENAFENSILALNNKKQRKGKLLRDNPTKLKLVHALNEFQIK